MTQAPPSASALSSSRTAVVLFAALVVLVGACLVFAANHRGIWMDEFWSLRLGDPTVPVAELFRKRWLPEANPMTANSLYRLVAATGAESIGALRVVFNLPAYLLMVATTIGFTLRSPSRSPFYAVLPVVAVGLPVFSDAFADYRSYFWQICWWVVLLQFLYRLVAEECDRHAGAALTAAGVASVFGAVVLHFVTGFIVSVTVGVALLFLAKERRWRAFATLAFPATVAWLVMLVLAAWQFSVVRSEIDYSWIRTTSYAALGLTGVSLAMALVSNPVATAFALLGWWVPSEPLTDGRPRTGSYALLLTGGFVLSAFAMLAINSLKPLIVDRYLIFWQLSACATIAALCARAVTANRLRLTAFVGVAAVSVGINAAATARTRNWNGTRDFIAEAVRRCPAARVYAMSPWRLGPGRDTRYAMHEGVTMSGGYHRLAREGGFRVALLGRGEGRLKASPDCPTLVWIEHLAGRPVPDAAFVVRTGGLSFDVPVRTLLFRTPNGLVLIARPIALDERGAERP